MHTFTDKTAVLANALVAEEGVEFAISLAQAALLGVVRAHTLETNRRAKTADAVIGDTAEELRRVAAARDVAVADAAENLAEEFKAHEAARVARHALEECRLLAARHASEPWAKDILRFCARGGVAGSPLRTKI